MKDAYYFSHDSNANEDPKIAALISKYDFRGYGWFWRLIELFRNQPGYKYPINKYTFDTLARILLCDRETIVQFLNDCCHEFATDEGALFCMDDNYIWSESLLRRMKVMDDNRKACSEAGKKGAEARLKGGSNGAQANKVNNTKEKEKIKYADLVFMTQDEHQKLVEKYGEILTRKFIEKLDNSKGAHGYKYKSDYKAVLTWVVESITGKKPSEFQFKEPLNNKNVQTNNSAQELINEIERARAAKNG